ncbi:hypothetical protein Nepgr_009016 [Nepenthes gracilis]|uniref:TF-B3 domain-containing protein n=1 Tax=Nepenthes gracilis TaxID=150966 RepID=A0AAD3SAL3_NEPGR|nr:hypothetical protein Nepgr_009016 [Nepenthes gracilis]
MEVKQEAKVEDVSMQRTHTCKQDYLETGSCGQTHLSSNNRQFVKTFDQAHPYSVRIPAWFLSQQGIIKCPKKILLRSENGAVQLVESFLMKDGRLDLRHGWKDFCLKNKVMHGDLCKFEILLDRGGMIKDIFVQISHKKD